MIVTGPPGAGKSTVTRLLADRLGSLVARVEADWFWTTIAAGHIPPWAREADRQNRTVLCSVTAAAAEMAAGGYQVIVDGIIGPWHLDAVIGRLDARDVDLEYVVLRPDLTTCLARARGRANEPPRVPGHPPLATPGPIRHMYNQFADVDRFESHVIDTTALDAGATVDAVLAKRDAGALALPGHG